MVKTIVIDAGHGGHDSGAVGNGLKEKDLTLSIALATERYLKEHYTGHRIVMTRRTDKYLSLEQRKIISNSYNTSLFVSIHINSASATAHGYESFISPYTKSTGMLSVVHNNIRDYFRGLGVHNRGLKKLGFYVLRKTHAPAILTENLFISNPKEARILKTRINEIAKAHAVGIAKALGLPQKKKEGGLTMSQYRELKKIIDDQQKEIADLRKLVGNGKGGASLASAWQEAIDKGITDGSNPGHPIKREEAAAMILRATK